MYFPGLHVFIDGFIVQNVVAVSDSLGVHLMNGLRHRSRTAVFASVGDAVKTGFVGLLEGCLYTHVSILSIA